MANDGAPEWTLVAAGHQTAGRGRLDRTWHDRPGGALLFSLVLRPRTPPALAGLITLLGGLALVEAVEVAADQRATCWWPNDVLVAGRKAAGILAVSSVRGDAFEHVILGVGANLDEPPPQEPDAAAVAADDVELLEAFLRRFASRYDTGLDGVVAAYRERCATIGERVRATTVDGEAVTGTAVDVEADGGLAIEADGGRRVVRFGDVERLVRGGWDAALE
jgi:BirA family biotin operon repressor/biotin-[acetyl-CoA-carboxylase] ligase